MVLNIRGKNNLEKLFYYFNVFIIKYYFEFKKL